MTQTVSGEFMQHWSKIVEKAWHDRLQEFS